jgi:sugar lactone lactonase YvrE
VLVTDDGVAWSQDNAARYEDGRWQRDESREMAAVSRDGTVWLMETQPWRLERDLGDGWTTCPTDGVPKRFQPLRGLSVAPDGSLWGTYRSGESSPLARFDCTEWSYPLAAEPVGGFGSVSIADDGSVWVLTSEGPDGDAAGTGTPLRQLYVITPKAVAAAE